MADISKLNHFSSSCSVNINSCIDTIMAACLQGAFSPGYMRCLQTVKTPPCTLVPCIQGGQGIWYYREGRDSSTSMKCQGQWRPSSKRWPFRGQAEKGLVRPRTHRSVHSLVIYQLKDTHVGFQKDQEIPWNAWKLEGNERTLNWFPLLCVCMHV